MSDSTVKQQPQEFVLHCPGCKEDITISEVEFEVFCENPTQCCGEDAVIRVPESDEVLGICFLCKNPLNDDGVCENHE